MYFKIKHEVFTAAAHDLGDSYYIVMTGTSSV